MHSCQWREMLLADAEQACHSKSNACSQKFLFSSRISPLAHVIAVLSTQSTACEMRFSGGQECNLKRAEPCKYVEGLRPMFRGPHRTNRSQERAHTGSAHSLRARWTCSSEFFLPEAAAPYTLTHNCWVRILQDLQKELMMKQCSSWV